LISHDVLPNKPLEVFPSPDPQLENSSPDHNTLNGGRQGYLQAFPPSKMVFCSQKKRNKVRIQKKGTAYQKDSSSPPENPNGYLLGAGFMLFFIETAQILNFLQVNAFILKALVYFQPVHTDEEKHNAADYTRQKESLENNQPEYQSIHKSRHHSSGVEVDEEVCRIFPVRAVIFPIYEILEKFKDEYAGDNEREIPSQNSHDNDKWVCPNSV